MKVMRLVEDSQDINATKENYENSSFKEKKELVNNFSYKLIECRRVLNKLYDFGERFLDSWIKSMKWEELGRENNELLNFFSLCDGNELAFNSIPNFLKLYNSYANGYISNKNLKDGLLVDLLKNDNLYDFNEDNFISILRLFDYSSKKFNDNDLRRIFFDDPDNPKTSRINSLKTILSLTNNNQNTTFNDIEDAIKDINNINDNSLNNLVDYLMSNDKFANAVRSRLTQ